jgi:type I restriction enzyme S subunit
MPKAQQEALSIEMIGRFPEWWPIKTLSQVCKQVTDGTHDSPKPTEKGFPLVTGKAIKNRRIDFTNTYKIADADHRKVIARSKPERNDILFANIGNSIGDLVRVDTDCEFSIKNVALFKPDQSIIVPKFLEYYLFSSSVQAFVKGSTRGSAQPFIGLSSLRGFPVPVPPFEEQLYIGKILGDLDDKIQLNHQINQTLEQIALAIFKSWFVDFEPVKAKIAALEAGGNEEGALLAAMQVIAGDTQECANVAKGSAPGAATGGNLARLQAEQPEQYAELRATAELFPSAMQDSELGEIPEGWNVLNLVDLCATITKGTTPKKSEIAEATDPASVSFIKVKDITNTGEIVQEGLETIPNSVNRKALKRSILETGDLLFSIAGTIGRVAIVDSNLASSNTNQAIGIIRLKEPGKHLSLVWQLLISVRIQNEIRSKVVQGVQANASLKNLRDIQVLLPCNHILEITTSQLDALLQKIASNRIQSRNLKAMRDALLPKLLSGELTIPDAESKLAEIEEATSV